MTSFTYLSHVFSANGMTPDPNKILAVQQWPTPTNVKTLAVLRVSILLPPLYTSFLPHSCPLTCLETKEHCLLL